MRNEGLPWIKEQANSLRSQTSGWPLCPQPLPGTALPLCYGLYLFATIARFGSSGFAAVLPATAIGFFPLPCQRLPCMFQYLSDLLFKFLQNLPRIVRVLLWAVALPLAVAAVGAWQLALYPDGQAQRQEEIRQLEGIQADLQAALQARPAATALTEVTDEQQVGQAAQMQVERRLQRLREEAAAAPDGDERAVRLVRLAAQVTVAAGVAAALWGGLGIWAARRSGRRAMRSRDELISAFSRWRHGLGRYLGLLLALLALALVALLVARAAAMWAALAGDGAARSHMRGGVWMLLLVAFAALGALAALWRLRHAMPEADEPGEVLGMLLSHGQAPGLWRHVTDLARRVGTAPPDHMVLGMTESFYVTCARQRVMPGGQLLEGRTLHLPLTYLSLLRRDETDAILAHELGHFLGEDSAYSVRFAPMYASMMHALDSVADGDEDRISWGCISAVIFGEYVLESFHRAVSHWSRVRELQADAVSARVAGPEAAARALVHVSALEPVVYERLSAIARRPAEAGQDLIAMLQADVQAHPLQTHDLDAEAATSHPFDSHPPTLERLRALGALPEGSGSASALPALAAPDADSLAWVRSLFADSDAVQRQLLQDFKTDAAIHNEERRRELTEIRDQVHGEVIVHEGRFFLWLTAFITLGLGAAVCACVMHRAWHAALGLLAACAFFAFMTRWFWLRCRHPVMTLTPAALLLPGLAAPLEWGDIEDFSAEDIGNFFTITFQLTSEAALPVRQHGNYQRLSVKAKKRSVIAQMSSPRGLKRQRLLDLLVIYLRAWHASEALRQM